MQEINYYKQFKHTNIISLVDSTFRGTPNVPITLIHTLTLHSCLGSADIVIHATSEALLVLPFFRRGTLHDYLALRSFNHNYLDVKDVLRLFSDICQAIKYLHDFTPDAIAHRDLKTANICLTENMDPVLMDLGSCAPARVQICGAQDAQKLQDLAAERCSMTYRAPELFHVESYCVIDQRTDIWVYWGLNKLYILLTMFFIEFGVCFIRNAVFQVAVRLCVRKGRFGQFGGHFRDCAFP